MNSKILKKIYAKFLPKVLRYPNVHTGAEDTRKLFLPFCRNTVIIRKTKSDIARVCEYINEIYSTSGYLSERLIASNPTLLVDVGANIGLSTLSMLQKYPSIREVIAIEAEDKNFSILEKNFEAWKKTFPHVRFDAKNAIASNEGGLKHAVSSLSNDPTLTASGTFRFEQTDKLEDTIQRDSISISSVIDSKSTKQGVIVKVDIEGGEEYLFQKNTGWMEAVSFLTIELHDRYDQKLLATSQNVINSILKHNFAVHPSEDVLHCYNRSMF